MIIANYRKNMQLTQSELAESWGVTQSQIAHLEKGRRKPSPQLTLVIEKKTSGDIQRHDLRPDIYPLDSPA